MLLAIQEVSWETLKTWEKQFSFLGQYGDSIPGKEKSQKQREIEKMRKWD